MKTEKIIINVMFDAAKGTLPYESREAESGIAFGVLPRPTRRGYTFEGWFLNGVPVTEETVVNSEEDILLVARWAKKKGGDQKTSMLRRQKTAVAVLSVLTVVLAVMLLVTNYIVAIFGLEDVYYDENGTEYTESYNLYAYYNYVKTEKPADTALHAIVERLAAYAESARAFKLSSAN